MAANNHQEDTPSSSSQWMRIYWSTFEDLSNHVEALPSTPTQELIPRKDASSILRNAERKLQHAVRLLDAKHEDIEDLWTTDVATATTRYKADAGIRDEDIQLSLSSMVDWTPQPVVVEAKRPGRAAGTKLENAPGHLPPRVIKSLFTQLDRANEEVGWLPGVQSATHRAEIDDELIQEVKEWQQENLED